LDESRLHIFCRRLLALLDQVLFSNLLRLRFQLLALLIDLLYLLALFVIAMLFELLLAGSELLAFFSDFFDLLKQLVGVEVPQAEVDVDNISEVLFRLIFEVFDYGFLALDDPHDVVFQLKAELGETHVIVALDALDTDREVCRLDAILVNQTLIFFRIMVNPNCIDDESQHYQHIAAHDHVGEQFTADGSAAIQRNLLRSTAVHNKERVSNDCFFRTFNVGAVKLAIKRHCAADLALAVRHLLRKCGIAGVVALVVKYFIIVNIIASSRVFGNFENSQTLDYAEWTLDINLHFLCWQNSGKVGLRALVRGLTQIAEGKV